MMMTTSFAALPQAQALAAPRRAGKAPRQSRLHAEPEKKQEASTSQPGKEAIYIGHEKYDYENKRVGKQGRFIMDDPAKYPGKEDVGFLAGITGGWAGGEVALKSELFKAEAAAAAAEAAKKAPAAAVTGDAVTTVTGKKAPVKTVGQGDDIIYLGYEKEDYETRNSGVPGRFVRDDARKYPSKDSFGPLDNMVGGFAGGELGVKQFGATGELKLSDGKGRRQPPSPLLIAGLVAFAGTAGGLLLTDVTELTEKAGGIDPASLPIDGSTKLLLEVAVGLLGVVGALSGARLFMRKAAETASSAGKIAIFWAAVAVAAKFVLEN